MQTSSSKNTLDDIVANALHENNSSTENQKLSKIFKTFQQLKNRQQVDIEDAEGSSSSEDESVKPVVPKKQTKSKKKKPKFDLEDIDDDEDDFIDPILPSDDDDSDEEGEGLSDEDQELLENALFGEYTKKKSKKKISNSSKKKKPSRESRRKIPAHISTMIGEANLCFISKQFKQAIKILTEIVRLMPSFPDPYQTMGLIYEELAQKDKALECYMLAALLTKSDAEKWKQLALMSQEIGNVEQTIYCYSRAVRASPNDYFCNLERAKLLVQIGDKKRAMEAYQRMYEYFPEDTDVVSELVKMYYADGHVSEAIDLLTRVLDNPNHFSNFNFLNLLIELYQTQGRFLAVSEIIQKSVYRNRISFEMLPIDIKAKYAVSKIFLNEPDQAEPIVQLILKEDQVEYGDLFYDIAEAYFVTGEPDRAYEIYQILISNPQFDTPTIWLRLATCLQEIDPETSIYYLNKVLEINPEHGEARLILSEVYKQLEQYDKALEALGKSSLQITDKDQAAAQDSEKKIEEIRLIVQKCNLLYAQENYKEYLNASVPLLKSMLDLAKSNTRSKKKKKRYVPSLFVNKVVASIAQYQCTWKDGIDALTDQGLLDFFTQTIKLLISKRVYSTAYRLLKSLIEKKLTEKSEQLKQLKYLFIAVSYYSKEFVAAYALIKELIHENPNNIAMWNLFNKIITNAGNYQSYHKYMTRQLEKYKNNVPLMVLLGNNCCLSGSYRIALGEYFRAYELMPNEPLICLNIGICFLNLVMNRRIANRNFLVVKAFAFLNLYHKLSPNKHEANYNLGRAYHQLGLTSFAIHYYEKVLIEENPFSTKAMARRRADSVSIDEREYDSDEDEDDNEESEQVETMNTLQTDTEFFDNFSLVREAAFNLSLIYRQSGNLVLARKIVQDFLTI